MDSAKKHPSIKIVVLGAGLAGLAAAEHLLDEYRKIRGIREIREIRGIRGQGPSRAPLDLDITILEKNSYLGGLASSFAVAGRYIPRYYHHVFAHDTLTKGYLDKFGLLEKMVWKKTRMGICAKGKIYDFTNPISLMRFDYLSLWGRIRYGLFGAYVFTTMNPKKIDENLNARAWLRKYAGREVTDELFYNLYSKNKFNMPLEKISAKQLAHRLKDREALGRFGYPSSGLQFFVDAFEGYLKKNNVKIIRNCSIRKIDLKAKKVIFRSFGSKVMDNVMDRVMDYDYLISTIPLPVFLKLAPGLDKKFLAKASKIKYCPCVCVAFSTKDFLDKHYWLNLIGERAHILFQHSNLFDSYGKESKINWILRYGGSEEDLKLSDREIKKAYLAIVKKYFPNARIKWSRVFRELYAEPIYDENYASKMPPVKCPGADGVYFAGTSVSYPKIRNMNSSLETGIRAGDAILEECDS